MNTMIAINDSTKTVEEPIIFSALPSRMEKNNCIPIVTTIIMQSITKGVLNFSMFFIAQPHSIFICVLNYSNLDCLNCFIDELTMNWLSSCPYPSMSINNC